MWAWPSNDVDGGSTMHNVKLFFPLWCTAFLFDMVSLSLCGGDSWGVRKGIKLATI